MVAVAVVISVVGLVTEVGEVEQLSTTLITGPVTTGKAPGVHTRFCRMLYGLPVDSASVQGAPTLLVVGVPLYAHSRPGPSKEGPALCAIVEHEVATLVQLPGVP